MRLYHLILLGGVLMLIAGCVPISSVSDVGSSSTASIQVTDIWARAAPGGNSAAYMVIRNTTATDDRLIKAESAVANAVELHKTSMEGGVMRMAPVDGIAVPAGGQVELKPGGLHVMFIGLKQELKAGEQVAITLHFEKAGALQVAAEVRKP